MSKLEKKLIKARTTKDLMWGMALYTGGSVLGPLIIIGGLGFGLDIFFSTKPIFLIIGVLLAFVMTNVLIFRKLQKLNKQIEKEMAIKDEKKQENSTQKNDKNFLDSSKF